MKQYRLKKWYPSLPKDWKVGMLCTKKDEDDIDYNPDFVGYEHYTILRTEVENNPEFWEEIVEKDYEILSFYYKNVAGKGDNYVDPDYIWYETYKGSGLWSRKGNITSPYTINELLNHNSFRIHSIKRLTDNQIFTIGDFVKETITGTCKGWIITQFSLKDTRCFSSGVNINNIQKLKPVLFTTEDGVDIREGDIIHQVNAYFNYYSYRWGVQYGCKGVPSGDYKMFSTKEAAEEYIMMNKPYLSINDISSIFTHGWELSILKDIIKNKLK